MGNQGQGARSLRLTARQQGTPAYLPIDMMDTLRCGIQQHRSGPSASTCTVNITNAGPASWEGVIRAGLHLESDSARFFLPAFLYGRNRPENGRGQFPRLRRGPVQLPYSPFWMVRADRLSHPVAMGLCGGRLRGVSGSPYRIGKEGVGEQWRPGTTGRVAGYNGFYCSIENGAEVGYTVGYENSPALYIHNNDGYAGPTLNGIRLDPGQSVEFALTVYDYAAADQACIASMIRDVYSRFHESPRDGVPYEDAARMIARGIADDSYLPELRNYSTQLHLQSEASSHFASKRLYKTDNGVHYLAIPSISWTGGLQCATPALIASLRFDNSAWRSDARECIGEIVLHSTNPRSGLPFDAYNVGRKEWTVEGWWTGYLGGPAHSSYVVGQALYYVLRAIDFQSRLRSTFDSSWIDFARRTMQKILTTQAGDGLFPYTWSRDDGQGIDYDGFAGCWCVAAGAYLAKLTDMRELVAPLRRALERYHAGFVDKFECYGTPHDTDKACDSEGVLAFVRAARLLHELTGDRMFLEYLRAGMDYELSYKFCYNSPVQVEPLRSLGWSSSGGTVTSTANPHIHPMSCSVIDELLYLWDRSGDDYIGSRLRDTVGWGLQSFNRFDGEFGFGKQGWMTERFCHSEGLLLEKYPDGSPASVWFCYLPWAAGCVLDGLCGDLWERKSELGY